MTADKTADPFTEAVRQALAGNGTRPRLSVLLATSLLLLGLALALGVAVARAGAQPQPGYDNCNQHPQLLVCATVTVP